MYEDIESGLIQTGIPYPNASGGHQYDPDHIDGSVIEFCGQEIDFNIYDYEMEGIVVYEKNN